MAEAGSEGPRSGGGSGNAPVDSGSRRASAPVERQAPASPVVETKAAEAPASPAVPSGESGLLAPGQDTTTDDPLRVIEAVTSSEPLVVPDVPGSPLTRQTQDAGGEVPGEPDQGQNGEERTEPNAVTTAEPVHAEAAPATSEEGAGAPAQENSQNSSATNEIVVDATVASKEAVVAEAARVGRAVHTRREAAAHAQERAAAKQKKRDENNKNLGISEDVTGVRRKAEVVKRKVLRAPQALRERAKAKAERLGTTDEGFVARRKAGAVDVIQQTPEVAKVAAEAVGKYFKKTQDSMRGGAIKARAGLEAGMLQTAAGGVQTVSDAYDHALSEYVQTHREPVEPGEKKGVKARALDFGRQAAMQAREMPIAKARVAADIRDKIEAGNTTEAITKYGKEAVMLGVQHLSGESMVISTVVHSVSSSDVGEAAAEAFNIRLSAEDTAQLGEDMTRLIEQRAQEMEAQKANTPLTELEEHTQAELGVLSFMSVVESSEVSQQILQEHPELTPFGLAQLYYQTATQFGEAALVTSEGLLAAGNTMATAFANAELVLQAKGAPAEVIKEIKARGGGAIGAFMDGFAEAKGGEDVTNLQALETAIQNIDYKQVAKSAAKDAAVYGSKTGVRMVGKMLILAQLGALGWKVTPAGLAASAALGAGVGGVLGFVKGYAKAGEDVKLAELETTRDTQLSASKGGRDVEEVRQTGDEKRFKRARRLFKVKSGAKTAGKQALAGAVMAPVAMEVMGHLEHGITRGVRDIVDDVTGHHRGGVATPGEPGVTSGNGTTSGGHATVVGEQVQLAADYKPDTQGEEILVGNKDIPVHLGTATFKEGEIVGGSRGDPGISAEQLKQFEEIIAQQHSGQEYTYQYDSKGGFTIRGSNNEIVGHLTYDKTSTQFEVTYGTSSPTDVVPIDSEQQPVPAIVVDAEQKTVILTANDHTEINMTGVTVNAQDELVNATTNQPILSSEQLDQFNAAMYSKFPTGDNYGFQLVTSDAAGSSWEITQNGQPIGAPEITISLNGELEAGGQQIDIAQFLQEFSSAKPQPEASDVIHIGKDTVEVQGFTVKPGAEGGLYDGTHQVLTTEKLEAIETEVGEHVQIIDATTKQPIAVEVVISNKGGKPVLTVYDANHQPILANEKLGIVKDYVDGKLVTETIAGHKEPEYVLGADWQAASGIHTSFDGRTITFEVDESTLKAPKTDLEWHTFNAVEWSEEVAKAIETGSTTKVGPLEIQGLYQQGKGPLYLGNSENHLYVMSGAHFEQFSDALQEHITINQVVGGHWDASTHEWVGGRTEQLTPLLQYNPKEHGFDLVDPSKQPGEQGYVLLQKVTLGESSKGPVIEWDKGSDVVTAQPDPTTGQIVLTVHDGVTDADVHGAPGEIPNKINIEQLIHEATHGRRGRQPKGTVPGTEQEAQVGQFEIVGLHRVAGSLRTEDGVTIVSKEDLPAVTRTLEQIQIESNGHVVQHPEIIFNQQTGQIQLVNESDPQDVLMTGQLGTTVSGHPEIMWNMVGVRATQGPNGIIINTDLHDTVEQGNIDLVTGQLHVHNAAVPAGAGTAPAHLPTPGGRESTQQFMDTFSYRPDTVLEAQQGTLHTLLVDNGHTERILEEGGHSNYLAVQVNGKEVFVRVKYTESGQGYVDIPLDDQSSALHDVYDVYGHSQPIDATSLNSVENEAALSNYIHNLPAGTLHDGNGDIAIAEYRGGTATLNAQALSFCNITNAHGVTTVTYHNAVVGTGDMPDTVLVDHGQAGVPGVGSQVPTGNGPQPTPLGPIDVEGLPLTAQGLTIDGQHISGAEIQQVGELMQEHLHFEIQGTQGTSPMTPEVIFNRDGSVTVLDAQNGEPLITDAHLAINPQTQQVELIGNTVGIQHQGANGVETVTFDGSNPYLTTRTITLNVPVGNNLPAIEALIEANQRAAAELGLSGNPGEPIATRELIYINPTTHQTTTLEMGEGRLYSSGDLVDAQHGTTLSSETMLEYQRVLPQIEVRNPDGSVVTDAHYVYANDSFVLVVGHGQNEQVIGQFYFDPNDHNTLDWNGDGTFSGHTFTIGNEPHFGSADIASFETTPQAAIEVMPSEVVLSTPPPHNQTVSLSGVTVNANGDLVSAANPNSIILPHAEVEALIPSLTSDIPHDVTGLHFVYGGQKGQDSLWSASYGGHTLPEQITVTPKGEILINGQEVHLTAAESGQLQFVPHESSPIVTDAVIRRVPVTETVTGEEVARAWESLSARPGTIREVEFDPSHQFDMSARVIELPDGQKALEIIQQGGNPKYMAFQMNIGGKPETIFIEADQVGNGVSHFIIAPSERGRVQIYDGDRRITMSQSELAQFMLHDSDLSRLPVGALTVAQESEVFRPKVISAANFEDGKVTYEAALLGDNELAREVTIHTSVPAEIGAPTAPQAPGPGTRAGGHGWRFGNPLAGPAREMDRIAPVIEGEWDAHQRQIEIAGAITAGYTALGFAQPTARRRGDPMLNRVRDRTRNAVRYGARGLALGVGVAALAPVAGPIAAAAKVGAGLGYFGTAAVRGVRPFTEEEERLISPRADRRNRRRLRRIRRRAMLIAGHGALPAVPGAFVGAGLAAAGAVGLHAAGVGAGVHGATGGGARLTAAVSGPSGAEAIGPLSSGALGTAELVGIAAGAVPVLYAAGRTARAWAETRRRRNATRPIAPAAPAPGGRVPTPPPPPTPTPPRRPMPRIVRGAIRTGGNFAGAVAGEANAWLNPWNEGRRLRREQLRENIRLVRTGTNPDGTPATPADRRAAAENYLQYKNIRIRPGTDEDLILQVADGLARKAIAVPVLAEDMRLHASVRNAVVERAPVIGLDNDERIAVREVWTNMHGLMAGWVNNQFETPGNVGLGLTRRAVAEIDRIMHAATGDDADLRDQIMGYRDETDPGVQRNTLDALWVRLVRR